MSNSIENLYIFDGFSKEVVAYFLLMSQVQYKNAGEVIMRQWDPSNGCAYYINSWSVRVMIDGNVVSTIGKGGFFWEIALITDEPRTATIEVLEDTELQVFLKEDFLTLIMQSPHSEEMKAEVRRRIMENVNNNVHQS